MTESTHFASGQTKLHTWLDMNKLNTARKEMQLATRKVQQRCLLRSTHFGFHWSCSKVCSCKIFDLRSRSSCWPAPMVVTYILFTHGPDTQPVSKCMALCTLRLISRGKYRGLHPVPSACSELHVWLPQHQHVLLLITQGGGTRCWQGWVIMRALTPCKTWEVYGYLLVSTTWLVSANCWRPMSLLEK